MNKFKLNVNLFKIRTMDVICFILLWFDYFINLLMN